MVRKIIFLFIFLLFLSVAIFPQDNGDEEEIFELKVKELSFTIVPTFKLIVPETSITLGLSQKIGETDFLAQSEYNYLHSKINYLLQYTLNFFIPFFVDLYDNVNFEKIYENKKYLQRNKGYGAGLQTPKIFDIFILKQEIKSENYYFASIEDKLNINQGNILLYNTWLEFLFEHKIKKEIFKDFYAGINFEKAILSDFTDYNFLFLNFILNKIFYFEHKRTIDFYIEYGYLLAKDKLPLWKIYTLGGYERLMGFGYDEFQGYYKVFSKLKGEARIWDKINFELLFLKLVSIDGFLVLNMGQVGNVYEIQDFSDYKTSIGFGTDLNILFRNKLKITLTFALAQAIKPGRSPVFYFVYFL